jgi:apolipoprotein N-acyltransferase
MGIVSAVVLVSRIDWRREPPAARAYGGLLFIGATAAGSCWVVAAVLNSHSWELAGAIILLASIAARTVLVRWLRRRYPDEG